MPVRLFLIALMAGLSFGPALAQVSMLASTADARAVACLQRPEQPLPYPPRDRDLRNGGLVRLSLRFTAPDRPPEVEVIARAASDDMVDAVRSHVKAYRLPCMDRAPVTTAQEFRFTPQAAAPVTWTELRPVQDPGEARRHLACLRTPADPPPFRAAGLEPRLTNIFVDMEFTAPDAPPAVKLPYSSASRGQERVVERHVAQYRLPCLPRDAKPVALRQQFQFGPRQDHRRVFKNAVTLKEFLSNVRSLGEQPVAFNFDTMACPFQVVWMLGRPKLDNNVGEIGQANPNRVEFLAWLAGLEMVIDSARFEELVGESMVIDVGCGALAPGS